MDELYEPYPGRDAFKALRVVNTSADKPNGIIIYGDDLGYGDLGCYGSTSIRTPHIDRLTQAGMRFTDYYACGGVCSPSRAGLLTGHYPFRSGMSGNPYPGNEAKGQRMLRNLVGQLAVLGRADLPEAYATEGLSDREMTVAAAFQVAGYRTAMIGKWHLGDFSQQPEFHPLLYDLARDPGDVTT